MTWLVVAALDEARDQLNARFPNRDKTSDGSIGDLDHQSGSSSHNPDRTGNPEFRDGDAKDEVRARDFDADLRDPSGVTMEMVVQHWVSLARQGKLWWVRYFIFNRRIWHKRDGYVTREYTGNNDHSKHVHVNTDFTQDADMVTNTNWHLMELGAPAPKPAVLVVDGVLGPKTIRRWQEVMGTTPDGIISHPVSQLVKKVQVKLRSTVDSTLVVDGNGIHQDGKYYRTAAALQRYLGSPVDGRISTPSSPGIKAVQRRLNENRF